MNKPIFALIAVLGVAVAAGAGYWMGQQRSDGPGAADKTAPAGKRGGAGADICASASCRDGRGRRALALYLVGSGVGYVSGQIFHVDGGLTQHL